MPSVGADPATAWDAARIRAARSEWQAAIGAQDRDWAIGEVTGCSLYAATCSGTDTLLPWLAQAAILGLLLLLPALARLLAGGTVAVLLALVPVTAFLLVVGGAGEPEAGFALAFLLGVAWILGVAGSVVSARRRSVPDHAGEAP